MSILSLKNINYTYEGAFSPVLNNVSVDFEEGKLYVIMGKSGSGKSTLLSLISGLDYSTGGDILYNGENVRELDKDDYRAKKVGVIFQGYNLLTTKTALENIVLSMNISESEVSNKKEYALNLLEKMGIDNETAQRKVLKLSGGEQQRVSIARALANNSNVIIADEPTGNLDSEMQEQIMDIFKNLAKEQNKCVIVVTHSKQVSKYANELYGLNSGKLVFIK